MSRLMFFIVIGVIVSDQLTKWWAQTQGLVAINPGVSFGFMATVPTWWLTVILTLVAVVLAWVSRSFWSRFPRASGLFWGGAIANLIDRWWWGGVRDWLPIPGVKIHNNLADWALAVAVILIGYAVITTRHEHSDSV